MDMVTRNALKIIQVFIANSGAYFFIQSVLLTSLTGTVVFVLTNVLKDLEMMVSTAANLDLMVVVLDMFFGRRTNVMLSIKMLVDVRRTVHFTIQNVNQTTTMLDVVCAHQIAQADGLILVSAARNHSHMEEELDILYCSPVERTMTTSTHLLLEVTTALINTRNLIVCLLTLIVKLKRLRITQTIMKIQTSMKLPRKLLKELLSSIKNVSDYLFLI